MTWNHAHLACIAIGVVTFCLAAPAQPRESSAPHCPLEYWPFGSVCIHSVTGDVINATANGCAPGYWRFNDLCIHLPTGDVEMAENRLPASGR